jgi:dihydroorotase
MPDLDPPLSDRMSLAHYKAMVARSNPIFHLTATATRENIEEIKLLHDISAIKVWLGTGPEDLVITKEEELRQILCSTDKVVMIHAEDETTLLRNYDYNDRELSIDSHADIYDRWTAVRATIKAITAAAETGRRVYLCHISTGEEVDLVRRAKSRQIRVYAEVAPHHLFLTEDDLERLGTLGKVNPPLRAKEDQKALWSAIADGTIDTIGSDTFAWSKHEKEVDYGNSPSGLPNLELTLPLLIRAIKEKRLSLQRAIELTSTNPARIFSIPKPVRSLFVDIDTPRRLITQLTDWQPYPFENLVGWPIVSSDTIGS